MLDAHQINVFLVATETLNFTEAGKRLHLSQSSVSQHIQALEHQFNTDLFIRSGRNVQLTDAGMTLIPLAREIVKQSILTEETMASLGNEVYGELQVSCSTTPGKYVLPQILVHFHNRYPKVKVSCYVTSQSDSIKMLRNGDVHFALTSLSQETITGAEFRIFMCDPIVLIAPKDHPWTLKGTIQPEELYNANFIMREETSGTHKAVSQALLDVDIPIDDLNTLIVLGNSEAIAIAIQEGLGVGFVSTTVLTLMREESIAPIVISGVEICRDIHIGRQTRRPATIAQTAFWDSIKDFNIPEKYLAIQP
jgi:DNA-binding transcriptional LysR family regulator